MRRAAIPNKTHDVSRYQMKKYIINTYWMMAFYCATVISIMMFFILMICIINDAFGFVAVKYKNTAVDVLGMSLEDASKEVVKQALSENVTKGLLRKLESEQMLDQRTEADVKSLFKQYVMREKIAAAWSLIESMFSQKKITQFVEENENVTLQFRNWVNLKFLTQAQSANPITTGIRTALLGSCFLIVIAMVFSVPFGIFTAIYLEEYAPRNRIAKLIQVNIYNLAGIPSIIYGLLGLAVFVRLLEPLTQGRTILSAGLTLGLMCLPIIIINSQEAIRAVPNTLRYSGYAIGATQLQVIWCHVLPYSFERILTGVILAVSRAVGETAPLVVIGAATFISVDPTGIFSKFTALPIQVYQWASRPQQVYQHLTAATVIVLVVFVLLLNSIAIVLRNRFAQQEKL